MQRFRHRLAGLDAMADQLRAHPDMLPVHEVAETVEVMEAVLAEVRELLPE